MEIKGLAGVHCQGQIHYQWTYLLKNSLTLTITENVNGQEHHILFEKRNVFEMCFSIFV